MKNTIKKLLVAVITMGILTACNTAEGADNVQEQEDVLKVGVVQIVEHTSLNTLRDSFAAEMALLGYDDSNVHIEYQNANNDLTITNTIIDSFKGDDKDIIVAIATPTALAAANVSEDIPVVFSAVSNPVAVGLVDSNESTGRNITGVSDYVSVEAILDFAVDNTEITQLGFLYNPGEDNSVIMLEQVKSYGAELGIDIVEAPAFNTSEVQQATQSLVGNVDAIFLPVDNTIASAMDVVTQITREKKIPVYASADSFVQDGALASIGITYEQVGQETARMVDMILDGEKTPSEIPVKVFTDDVTVFVNETTAEELQLDFSNVINDDNTIVFN